MFLQTKETKIIGMQKKGFLPREIDAAAAIAMERERMDQSAGGQRSSPVNLSWLFCV